MRISKALSILLIFLLVRPLFSANEDDYTQALQLTIKFYGAQRCGDAHNWLLTNNPYGSTCHLEDGPALRSDLDLNGGWHDAGDHIKFTMTTGFAAFALLKSYDVFPEGFNDNDDINYSGNPNGIPDILDEVKIATNYLLKVHPDDQTVIARVGGDQDHSYWYTSPYQSTLSVSRGGGKRPVFANAKADIAGIAAAALALMSRVYHTYDNDYAPACLTQARRLYQYAKEHPGTTNEAFYQKNTWKDAMLCGAAALYNATGELIFLDEAISWNNSTASHGWVVDWSTHWDYGRHSLVKAGYTQALANWRRDVDRYLRQVSNYTYVKGLAFFGNWGSLRYAAGAAFSAGLLYDVTDEIKYLDFTRSQADYIMGDNEYNRSFIIGWGENYPQYPHHVNAYGREVHDWNFNQPPLHSLKGAMVGGPTRIATDVSSAGYEDDINDYIGNEVTIDYNSAIVGTLAALAHNGNTSVNGESSQHPDKILLHQNYPNPFNSQTELVCICSSSTDVQIIVYNILGQAVSTLHNGSLPSGSHIFRWNAAYAESGIYYCRLTSSSGNRTLKMILIQ
ncbi:glycoside hydrolase family 9 protein [bacterium]|nr:glycoside hydrolase family 9 protein [bacterium]